MDPPVVLVLAAVERELEPLEKFLERPSADGVRTRLTGAGKINSALETERALRELRPAHALLIGCGGAFPAARLAPGDVAIASEEVLADEGVESPSGFLLLEELGLPAARRGETQIYNRVPVATAAPDLLEDLRRCASSAHRVAAGRFITVSSVSGTEASARTMAARWAPIVESMEGAAAALVCWRRGIPFHEIRGVSNRVGPRERGSWNIDAACENAARTAAAFLERLERTVQESGRGSEWPIGG